MNRPGYTLLLVTFLVQGCRAPSPAPPRLLEDHFAGPRVSTLQHNQFYAHLRLKPGEDQAAVEADLIHYLRGDSPDVATHIHGVPLGSGSEFRARDLWAIVLANLKRAPLHLILYDTEEVRDRKIRELLDKLDRESRPRPPTPG